MSVRDLIRKEFYDILDAGLPTIPVLRENHDDKTPRNTPHIIVWFKYGKSGVASIGTSTKFIRINGFFMLDVVVPASTGSAKMWQIVDDICETFKEQNFNLSDSSNVTIKTPNTSSSPRPQDGYYFVTVMVPFTVDTKETT